MVALQKTVVQVAYVNPPGEGFSKGSIKDSAGNFFSVWPNMLDKFQSGGTYEIEFDSYTKKSGKVDHTVKTVKPVDGFPHPAHQTNTTPSTSAAPVSAPVRSNGAHHEKDKQIFAMALVKSAIEARELRFSRELVKAALIEMGDLWEEMYGSHG